MSGTVKSVMGHSLLPQPYGLPAWEGQGISTGDEAEAAPRLVSLKAYALASVWGGREAVAAAAPQA